MSSPAPQPSAETNAADRSAGENMTGGSTLPDAALATGEADVPGATAESGAPQGLRSAGYVGLLLTQTLGAFNDNMFRWLAVPLAQQTGQVDPAAALSIGLACFTLPYLVLATLAGYLADRFPKRDVIVWCKVAEIVLMALGTAAILAGDVWFLFATVGLMGCQSALFGPAKYGSLPEMLAARDLSTGNGLMGMVTVGASAGGTIAGFVLFDAMQLPAGTTPGWEATWPSAAALIGVAVAGWVTSLFVKRLPAADPTRRPAWNPVGETWSSLKLLASDRPILRTVLGIAFFWFLASLANVNIDPFGGDVLGLSKTEIGVLLAVLVVGVGAGSVLAGLISGGHVELGLVPLGAAGIATASLALFATGSGIDPASEVAVQSAYVWSTIWLFLLGVSAGLFNVPLEAYLQHRSDPKSRGTILAAANFVSFSFMLVAAGLFWVLSPLEGPAAEAAAGATGLGGMLLHAKQAVECSSGTIFLLAGLGTIPVVVYVVLLLPDATIRFLVWIASRTVYRVRVHGRENLPVRGGALLVANHVTWIDGILLLLASSRPIRMLAYADYVQGRWTGWLARIFGVIPIKAEDGPKALIRSLQSARDAVAAGELVCIFAEGQLTRTGQLQPFQRGLLRIVQGTGAPVIPVYLDELWGSIFSYSGGKFFRKLPKRWPYPVSICFGRPLNDPDDVDQVRRAVESLGVESLERRKARAMIPARKFLRKARQSLFRAKVADSNGIELTGGKLLAGTLAFRRVLNREVLAADEKHVGVFLPPSVGGVLANAALTLSGRVAVNLNYTLSDEDLAFCVKKAGLKHVLTSRKVLERKPVSFPGVELVCLEDLKPRIGRLDKALAALQAYAVPVFLLERMLGLTAIKPDDLLTVIFTSGSTGEPKGVMLSHHNVGSNIDAVDQLFHIRPDDVLLGVLPFFHSFGYTGTLWLTLTLDPKTVYHSNPLDAKTIGKLCQEHGATIVMATPTFLRTYLKRCSKEEFHKLNLVIVGAEKLPQDLAESFHEKYGVHPTEGYGTTELSPVAAFNVPPERTGATTQRGSKPGTVGRVMPGATAKTVDPDTWAERKPNAEGLLLIKGPNVMQGYLDQPEKTAQVIRDGWYVTGDFAVIDDEGFIRITGRQSRFSKIGGEMVPHIRVEELLNRLVEDPQDDQPGLKLAVSSVPDPKKGERLVVLHKPLPMPVDELLRRLALNDIPNLWLPARDAFLPVDEIPLLGTGKLDLKRLKETALALSARAASAIAAPDEAIPELPVPRPVGTAG